MEKGLKKKSENWDVKNNYYYKQTYKLNSLELTPIHKGGNSENSRSAFLESTIHDEGKADFLQDFG